MAPGGAILTMTSSSAASSQITSRSSPGPSPPSCGPFSTHRNSKTAGIDINHNDNHNNTSYNAGGGMFLNSGVVSSSPLLPTSPVSSPASQGSRSSGSSVITKSCSAGSQDHAEGRGGSPQDRSSSSASGDSVSFAQKLQLGAFLPHQSSPFAQDAAPLDIQGLIGLQPQYHNSSMIFSKSMGLRGPVEDVTMLDLELRLGPAQ